MAPLRIAVLECDKPLDQARIKLGAHAGVWRKVFEQASHFLESPVLTSYDVVDDQNYPDLSSVNGILVSGSRYSAYGEEEWVGKLVNFVSEAIEKRIPVVGICFGHQIVARALGAEVARGSGGWEVGPWTIGLNKTGQELFGKQEIVGVAVPSLL
jgi:GMP synthase-like glutamine amidotransferase